MAVTTNPGEVSFTNVVAGNLVNTSLKCFKPEDLKIAYGSGRIDAVYGVDYTAKISESSIASFIPNASLIALAGGTLNKVYVRVELSLTSDFTETDGFIRRRIADEFDRTVLRFQQFFLNNVRVAARLLALEGATASIGASVAAATAAAGVAQSAAQDAQNAVTPGLVATSRYPATNVGFNSAEASAAGSATPGVRTDSGRTLFVDNALDMSGAGVPRVPVVAGAAARFKRVADVAITFLNQFFADRHQVFVNWPADKLSFLAGTDQYPEWHDDIVSGSADTRTALQKALDCLNNAKVLLDARNYKLSANINAFRSYGGLIGKGEVITNFELAGTSTSFLQVNPTGSDGDRRSRMKFKDFTVTRAVPGSGIGGYGLSSYWTQGSEYENIQIDDLLVGVYLKRSPNTLYTNVKSNYAGNSDGAIGFWSDGNGGGAGAQGNASVRFNNCSATRTESASGTGSIGFKVDGAYCGDHVFFQCDTQFRAIGFSIDLSGVTPNASGGADITVLQSFIDGWTTAGYYQKGNVDNLNLGLLAFSWINPRGPAASGGVGQLFENTAGFMSRSNQFGINGRYITTGSAIRATGSKDLSWIGDRIVDWGRTIDLDATSDCVVAPEIGGGGNVAGGSKGITLTNASKRNKVRPDFMQGAVMAYGVSVGAGGEDTEIRIGPTDLTNFLGFLVIDSGARSRIDVAADATKLSLAGTDTFLTCDPTDYTPVASVAAAFALANWVQARKRVQLDLTFTPSVAPGGVVIVPLPRNAKVAGGAQYVGYGRNDTTKAALSVWIDAAGTVNIANAAGTGAPGASGQKLAVSIAYTAQ